VVTTVITASGLMADFLVCARIGRLLRNGSSAASSADIGPNRQPNTLPSTSAAARSPKGQVPE
jgi:hypothetical protein